MQIANKVTQLVQQSALGLSIILALFLFSFSTAFAAHVSLFSDGFESGDFLAWDGSGSDWFTVNNPAGAHSGDYRAEGRGDASTGSVIVKYQSTAQYEDIIVSFWYQLPGSGFEVDEDMDVDYTLDGGANWHNLIHFEDGDEVDVWTEFSSTVAGAENNPDFGIRFQTNADSANDVFKLDDVAVKGLLLQPEGEIISPEADETVTGMVDLVATYNDHNDDNDDEVNWAVRPYSPACNTGSNLFGGGPQVSGVVNPSPFTFDGADFNAQIDTSLVSAGEYCFVFNPTDDAGENNVREIVSFFVAETYVSGGGHILEGTGKRKNLLDISFGGWLADVGELVGDWTVRFHNVGDDSLDKGTFHAEDFSALNYFAGNETCDAMNFTASGTFNGEAGYTLVVTGGDTFMPASKDGDSIKFILSGPGVSYDSSSEFSTDSNCVGTVRSELDNGNLNIVDNS